MKNKKTIIIAAVALIVGFGGGMAYQGSKSISLSPQQQFGQMNTSGTFQRTGGVTGTQQRVQRGGGMTTGEVLSKDATSVTVKMADGSSKIVFFSSSTQIMKSSSGSSDDLREGENIIVTGTQNSDGSVSAQSIQLRPEFRMNQLGQ